MDSIEHNGKTYPVLKKLTFGEVSHIRRMMGELIEVSDEIQRSQDGESTTQQLMKMSKNMVSTSKEQDQLMVDTIEKSLGLTQDEIDLLEYSDASQLFTKIFQHSTLVKKKLEKPSVSPSKPETSQSQD